VLKGLEDAYRIINTVYMTNAKANRASFPSPVTLIPTYPDLPMEHVYPLIPETDIRGVYLNDLGTSRIAYFPGDIDRSFWQLMTMDHGKLLRNTFDWALNEEPIIEVQGPGVIDTTVWRQEGSMTVHLVNLTNPMMMKGPFRELLPVSAKVRIKIPQKARVKNVHLLVRDEKPSYEVIDKNIELTVSSIPDHEIIGIDLV
jgi:hypothetical protein